MIHDVDDPIADHQFIAAALRKCPDAIHGGNFMVGITRVKFTENDAAHAIEPSDALVHGAIVTFGTPGADVAQTVFVFVDEAREEPIHMAHEYLRAHQHS